MIPMANYLHIKIQPVYRWRCLMSAVLVAIAGCQSLRPFVVWGRGLTRHRGWPSSLTYRLLCVLALCMAIASCNQLSKGGSVETHKQTTTYTYDMANGFDVMDSRLQGSASPNHGVGVLPAPAPLVAEVQIEEAYTKITQPDGAITPATLTTDDEAMSTGAGPKLDQAIAAMSSLQPVGLGICLAGIGALVLRRWLPVIPVIGGLALILFGAGVLAMPVIADRYLGWILIGVAVAAVGYIFVVGSKANWFKLKVSPTEQARLLAKGDREAAAAITCLHTGSTADAKAVKQASNS